MHGFRPPACLLLVLVLMAVLGAPTAAQAAVRSGSATDPTGDATEPSYDISGLTAGYDEAGTLTVTASFVSPLPDNAQGPSLTATFTDDVGGCSLQTTTFAGLTGGTGSGDAVVLVTPVDGDVTSSRSVSSDRRSLTFTGSGASLAAKDLRCVTAAVGPSSAPIDALDVPLRLQGGSDLFAVVPPAAPPASPGPSAAPAAQPAAVGTATAPVGLTLSPTARAARVRSALAAGLRVRPGCSRTCRVGIDVSVPVAVARRVGLATRRDRRTRVVVASAKRGGVSGDDVVLVRFGTKARRALGRQRRIDLRVEVRASAAGKRLTRVVAARLTR